MTLADRNILDARGDLDEDGDELENVLAVSCTSCCADLCTLTWSDQLWLQPKPQQSHPKPDLGCS